MWFGPLPSPKAAQQWLSSLRPSGIKESKWKILHYIHTCILTSCVISKLAANYMSIWFISTKTINSPPFSIQIYLHSTFPAVGSSHQTNISFLVDIAYRDHMYVSCFANCPLAYWHHFAIYICLLIVRRGYNCICILCVCYENRCEWVCLYIVWRHWYWNHEM